MTSSHPVLIMGAHGGIGAQLAEIMSSQGNDLILTARDVGTIHTACRSAHAVDVLDAASLELFLDECRAMDALSGFAYCIGSIALKPFGKVSEEDLAQGLDLNLGAAFRILQALEKPLKAGNGSVVLFSTIAVDQGFPNHTMISAAKGAVQGFATALAAEWAPHVRVNVVAPSLTDTALASPLTSSGQMAKAIAAMHPIPRLGEAEDSAHMAAFLLDMEKSGWISGQIMHVDGGRSTLRTKG